MVKEAGFFHLSWCRCDVSCYTAVCSFRWFLVGGTSKVPKLVAPQRLWNGAQALMFSKRLLLLRRTFYNKIVRSTKSENLTLKIKEPLKLYSNVQVTVT